MIPIENLQNKRKVIEQKIEFNQGFERGYMEQIIDPKTTLDKANNPLGNYRDKEFTKLIYGAYKEQYTRYK